MQAQVKLGRMPLGAGLLATLATLATLTAAAPARAELRAGAANADITPPIGTPMFAYTARSRVADAAPHEIALQIIADPDSGLYAKTFAASRGIHMRVRARALVLDSGTARLALVQTDLGGIPYALLQRVGELIAPTGIPLANVMVAATHTHSSTGPIWPTDSTGYAVLGGDAYDARIFELTARGIAQAIVAANANLVPARLGVATTAIRDASRNRSFEPFQRNGDVPAEETAAREHSIDPRVTVVRVDEPDGRPIGVWSNFAIHATSFGDENLLFSGDNPGFTERIVEAAIRRAAAARGRRARRPGTVVNVWTNAAEGDISPDGAADAKPGPPPPPPGPGEEAPRPERLQYSSNSFTGAHMAGAKVARGVVRAWRRAGRAMVRSPRLDARLGYVAFDGEEADGEPVGPNAVLGRGGVAPGPFGEDGSCAPVEHMAGPGQGWKDPALGGPGDTLVPGTQPVSVMRVGSLGVVGFPSEVTKQMGQRILGAVAGAAGGTFAHVALSGLTNGYSSYTATPEEYDACYYEGSFTLFGRRQGPLYRDVAVDLTKALVAGEPYAGDPEPAYRAGGEGVVSTPGATPRAGETVEEPPPSVTRYDRVSFRWRGGHPEVDAPRGRALVTTQRLHRGRWRTHTTDDGFLDTLERDPETDVFTQTLQTHECTPTGLYRFLVRGRADKGAGPVGYTTVSRPFAVRPIMTLAPKFTRTRRRARVEALYPDPGRGALLALPRVVRSGFAVLIVKAPGRRARWLPARLTSDRLGFARRVAPRARVRLARVADGCGNTGRPRPSPALPTR